MKLPHLNQVIELHRGEAHRLWWVIVDKCRRILLNKPADAAPLLALPALQRVARRLKAVDDREQAVVGIPSRKPRRFRLHYDELVAIMLYVLPEPVSMARVPLGKIQQQSLNLEQWISFQPEKRTSDQSFE